MSHEDGKRGRWNEREKESRGLTPLEAGAARAIPFHWPAQQRRVLPTSSTPTRSTMSRPGRSTTTTSTTRTPRRGTTRSTRSQGTFRRSTTATPTTRPPRNQHQLLHHERLNLSDAEDHPLDSCMVEQTGSRLGPRQPGRGLGERAAIELVGIATASGANRASTKKAPEQQGKADGTAD